MENSIENQPIKNDLSKVNEDMLTNLATAEPIMNLNKTYAKFEEGKARRFVFGGVTEFVKEEYTDQKTGEITPAKTLPAVNLIDGDKNIYITASNVIVNACKDLPEWTGLEIELTGTKKLTGGKKLNEFRIMLLNA
jgi:hypothetical protein